MAYDPLNDPAAYGSIPAPAQIGDTASEAVGGSAALGTQVYSQLPGYQSSLGNIGANIGAETTGQVSEDVIQLLKQQGAEGGVASGAASNAAYLRALGLTSLGLEEQGMKDFESILPELPGAALASNPNFYVTPEQRYQAQVQNNMLAAAPNPYAAAKASMAAAGSGFNAGVGPGMRNPNTGQANRIVGVGPDMTSSGYPAPVVAYGPGGGPNAWDTTPAPGTPGAYSAWNAWNGTPTYPQPAPTAPTDWNASDEAIPQSPPPDGTGGPDTSGGG